MTKPNGSEPGDEPSGGTLSPSPELEEALREAAEAVGTGDPKLAPVEADGGDGAEAAAPDAGTVEAVADEIDVLRAELEQLKERHVRLQADFENQRKRALKDRQEAHQYGHEGLVKDLLGTVDNLDRAIEHAGASDGGDLGSMLQGVELVRRELLGALGKHGVSEIEADGQLFDPNVHEAMAQAPDDSVPPGSIVQVLQKGYRLRERLLRPTRVMVSKASEKPEADAKPEAEIEDAGTTGEAGETGEG